MRRLSAIAASLFIANTGFSGETEIKAAQRCIEAQLDAFLAGDNALAYSYAAPNIQRIFPTVETFMGMVANGYQPVARPKNFAFGKSEETRVGSVTQQVLLLGPDGKDYEAVYTLELQPDGFFRITGVSLRSTNPPSI